MSHAKSREVGMKVASKRAPGSTAALLAGGTAIDGHRQLRISHDKIALSHPCPGAAKTSGGRSGRGVIQDGGVDPRRGWVKAGLSITPTPALCGRRLRHQLAK